MTTVFSKNKLTRPRSVVVFRRKNLNNKLDLCFHSPVTWIHGPAGSGKTTLINSYLSEKNRACIWYPMDSGDGESITFFTHLSYGIGKLMENTEVIERLPHLKDDRDMRVFSKSFFIAAQKIFEKPTTIVFDDFHKATINSNFIEQLVDGLLQLKKPDVNVVICSRHAPPREFMRLMGQKAMTIIDNQDLKLETSESKDLLGFLTDSKINDAVCYRINEQLQGWMSGLVLASQMLDANIQENDSIDIKDKTLFYQYFSNEVLEKLDDQSQNILFKLSLFKKIDINTITEFLPDCDCVEYIKYLHEQNFFIQKNNENNNTYTLHPLFRTYLLERASNYVDEEELFELKSKLAKSFILHNDLESAMDLLIDLKEWDTIVKLIHKNASNLVNSNDFHLLSAWFEKLPEAYFKEDARLNYWYGVSVMPQNPDLANSLLKQSYLLINAHENESARIYVLSAIVESILLSWKSYSRLEKWIGKLVDVIQTQQIPNDPELRMKLAANLYCVDVLTLFLPNDIQNWYLPILSDDSRVNQLNKHKDSLFLMDVLQAYQAYFSGDSTTLLKLSEVYSVENTNHGDHNLKIISQLIISIEKLYFNHLEDAVQLADIGLAVSQEHGVSYWNKFLLIQKGNAFLLQDRMQDAINVRQKISKLLEFEEEITATLYFDFSAFLELKRGDYPTAQQYMRLSTSAAKSDKLKFYALPLQLNNIEIQLDTENVKDAKELITEISTIVDVNSNAYQYYRYYLLLSDYHLKCKDQQSAFKTMKTALQIAKEKGYLGYPWWQKQKLVKWYEFALANCIETDFVIECIKHNDLGDEINLIEYSNWNWPIKITTFGEFRLEINNKKVDIVGKGQRKPIHLLKAILSFGMRNIRQETLSSQLWPDSNGEEAQQALYTTIHRLRKTLGQSKSIVFKDGYVSLNADLVWIDIEALLSIVRRINHGIQHKLNPNNYYHDVKKLFGLYQMQFLQSDVEESWIFSYREHLHSKILICLKNYLTVLKQYKQYQAGLEVCEELLKLDESNEMLYREKIELLIVMERNAEAISCYQQCRKMLSKILGVMPSKETLALVGPLQDKTKP